MAKKVVRLIKQPRFGIFTKLAEEMLLVQHLSVSLTR
jgi:hypothetical protein